MSFVTCFKGWRQWSAAICIATGAWMLLAVADCARGQSPYATEVVARNGAYGPSVYGNPLAVLGEPTRIARNNDPLIGNGPFHTKIVEAAYNVDLNGNNVVTTLARQSNGSGGFTYGSITVKFDHPVMDDPTNPYGIDLNAFGNSFYSGSGFVSDTTDMRSYTLVGASFEEPVVISVSPDNINWYTYASGPYGDTAFPTQGHAWSGPQHDATGNGWTATPMDFTKPVNPTLAPVLAAGGIAAVDAMDTYVGAGGGTGIDLAASGFSSIQYARLEATQQFRDGEIDALADVRPARVGESLSITPANVADQTRLFFQDPADTSRTGIRATFTELSGLAKLATGDNPDALAALGDRRVFASYELSVSSLIGEADVAFSASYELAVGPGYAGTGAGLAVVAWDGATWQAQPFSFDAASKTVEVSEWTNPLAVLALVGLTGDFNFDGRVDATDYVVWRKGLGAVYSPSDYAAWRENFGRELAVGSGAGLSVGAAVAEPGVMVLVVSGLVTLWFAQPRRKAR